jgi:hypothetical protein
MRTREHAGWGRAQPDGTLAAGAALTPEVPLQGNRMTIRSLGDRAAPDAAGGDVPDRGVVAPRPAYTAPPWVHSVVRIMDEAIRIPGTKFRIGWDAILGFIFPGVGDAVSAVSHVTLLFQALRAGVPAVVIARMVLNVAIDELWGSVPIIGDLFDAGFRANRKNLDLIERRGGARRRVGVGDYLVVGGAIVAVIGIVLLPLIAIGALGGLLVQWLNP